MKATRRTEPGSESEHREAEWPPPRDDPAEEPSHRAGRIADRERGDERGDVFTEEEKERIWQR
jgi:hypothetical protein